MRMPALTPNWTGSTVVSFTVQPNAGVPRTGTILAAGQPYTVEIAVDTFVRDIVTRETLE